MITSMFHFMIGHYILIESQIALTFQGIWPAELLPLRHLD